MILQKLTSVTKYWLFSECSVLVTKQEHPVHTGSREYYNYNAPLKCQNYECNV